MMQDLISKQAAIEALSHMCSEDENGITVSRANVDSMLKTLPSAQPERKKGRWEMLQIPISPPIYKCSECGSHALQVQTGCLVNRHYKANLTKFCHNCGADMREESEEITNG